MLQWIDRTCRQRKYQGEPPEASAADPSTLMRVKQEHRTLVQALQRLPFESRVLLELVDWER